MTDKERIELLEYLRQVKTIYKIHKEEKIIKEDKEREAYLFELAVIIGNAQKKLLDDLEKLN
jgi:hypothetical protein